VWASVCVKPTLCLKAQRRLFVRLPRGRPVRHFMLPCCHAPMLACFHVCGCCVCLLCPSKWDAVCDGMCALACVRWHVCAVCFDAVLHIFFTTCLDCPMPQKRWLVCGMACFNGLVEAKKMSWSSRPALSLLALTLLALTLLALSPFSLTRRRRHLLILPQA
jgi:hypothetical protein